MAPGWAPGGGHRDTDVFRRKCLELEQADSGDRDLPVTGHVQTDAWNQTGETFALQSLLSPGFWDSGTVRGVGVMSQIKKRCERRKLQKYKLMERGVSRLIRPSTGTLVRATGSVTWSLTMLLFQSVRTEEGLAATAAVGEAELPPSPTGEAEASSVPTEGPALSLSTEDTGEGVTLVSSSELCHFWGRAAISGGGGHWSSFSVCRI